MACKSGQGKENGPVEESDDHNKNQGLYAKSGLVEESDEFNRNQGKYAKPGDLKYSVVVKPEVKKTQPGPESQDYGIQYKRLSGQPDNTEELEETLRVLSKNFDEKQNQTIVYAVSEKADSKSIVEKGRQWANQEKSIFTEELNGETIIVKHFVPNEVGVNFTGEILCPLLCSGEGIVQLYSILCIGINLWILMEYAGKNLRITLGDPDFKSWAGKLENLKFIFHKLISIVRRLEDHGIVHRDIKPDNICMAFKNEKWIPTLVDFGSAFLVKKKEAKYNHTAPVNVTGEYLTRELGRLYLDGKGIPENTFYNEKCDVWAMGITFLEIKMDCHPYHFVESYLGCLANFNSTPEQLGELRRKAIAKINTLDGDFFDHVLQQLPEPLQEILSNIFTFERKDAWTATEACHKLINQGPQGFVINIPKQEHKAILNILKPETTQTSSEVGMMDCGQDLVFILTQNKQNAVNEHQSSNPSPVSTLSSAVYSTDLPHVQKVDAGKATSSEASIAQCEYGNSKTASEEERIDKEGNFKMKAMTATPENEETYAMSLLEMPANDLESDKPSHKGATGKRKGSNEDTRNQKKKRSLQKEFTSQQSQGSSSMRNDSRMKRTDAEHMSHALRVKPAVNETVNVQPQNDSDITLQGNYESRTTNKGCNIQQNYDESNSLSNGESNEDVKRTAPNFAMIDQDANDVMRTVPNFAMIDQDANDVMGSVPNFAMIDQDANNVMRTVPNFALIDQDANDVMRTVPNFAMIDQDANNVMRTVPNFAMIDQDANDVMRTVPNFALIDQDANDVVMRAVPNFSLIEDDD